MCVEQWKVSGRTRDTGSGKEGRPLAQGAQFVEAAAGVRHVLRNC